jgi:C4-type Zn-finger protein
MAKATTFAEKAAKMAKKEMEITCPVCGKPTKLVYAKQITSVKSEKGTWKFLEKNVKLCTNCTAEI